MQDDDRVITRGIAQQAQHSPAFKDLANKGLIDFLREQIADAEWTIARAKAEIAAYEQAIEAIEARSRPASLPPEKGC